MYAKYAYVYKYLHAKLVLDSRHTHMKYSGATCCCSSRLKSLECSRSIRREDKAYLYIKEQVKLETILTQFQSVLLKLDPLVRAKGCGKEYIPLKIVS